MQDDASSSGSSSSEDEEETIQSTSGKQQQQQEEQLVTRLQLRLAASHLPKTAKGGGRLHHKLSRKSPDTFATVTSIVNNTSGRGRGGPPQSYYRHSDILQDCASSLGKDKCMVEWGSTEVIRHTTSPQWVATIPLDYEYGSQLHFYVRVIQAESGNKNGSGSSNGGGGGGGRGSDCSGIFDTPEKNRTGYCFGSALFEVGDILGSRNYTKVKRLKGGGCVYVRVEPLSEKEEELKTRFRFQFQSFDLAYHKRKRLSLGKSAPDTILEIARKHDSPSVQSWVTVFRSNPVFGSYNPCWDVAEIDLESCCRDEDLGQHIQLSVLRVKEGHKRKPIGMCETTMQNIIANAHNNTQEEPSQDVIVSEKDFLLQQNIQRLKEVGKLRVKTAILISPSGQEMISPSFGFPPPSPSSTSSTSSRTSSPLSNNGGKDPFTVDLRQMPVHDTTVSYMSMDDFIDGGGNLEFCVAIDYTSSNGNPMQEGTLHFQSDEAINDYEETITAIGSAINRYNPSAEIPVWGFGAKFCDGIVRHLFQCGHSQTVAGVGGILTAYQSVFRSGGITMSGPTVFSKAIQAAAVRARNYKTASEQDGKLRYCVLLVITDGVMANFTETKQKLDIYTEVPLSVVFVGVGRADFTYMHALCQPENNPHARRRNTTFVAFRQHQHDPTSLAQAALNSIPSHISEYMAVNGIQLSKQR